MSREGEGQRARGGVDPAELCRRIVVCFSASELRQLADAMGVGEQITFGRGANEAARDLVRHFERRGELGILLEELRESRPLVEWPEAEVASPEPYEPIEPSADVAPIAPLPSPGTLGGASGPPLIDPFLAKPAGPTEPMTDAPPKSASVERGSREPNANRAPAPPSSQGFSWPGTVGGGAEPSAPSRGIDPKILILVSGLMLLAALIAFIAGRSGSSSAPSPDASATAGDPDGKKKGDAPSESENAAAGESATAEASTGPGAILANDIARSLANVARACEIPIRGAAFEDVLLRAFDQCGPPPAPTRPIGDPLPPRQDTPSGDKPNENAGAGAQRPAGNAQRPAGNAKAPPLATPPGTECMRSCDSEHKSCTGRCGKEPTQGSLYNEYTGCLSRCLTTASRCRLNCK